MDVAETSDSTLGVVQNRGVSSLNAQLAMREDFDRWSCSLERHEPIESHLGVNSRFLVEESATIATDGQVDVLELVVIDSVDGTAIAECTSIIVAFFKAFPRRELAACACDLDFATAVAAVLRAMIIIAIFAMKAAIDSEVVIVIVVRTLTITGT
jgi:hypothetical protein